MKRIFLIIAAVGILSGCGVNVGSNNAVKNLTIGEILVSPRIDIHQTRDDVERKLNVLRSSAPFDIDKKLGDALSKNASISNVRIISKPLSSDANSIRMSFLVNNQFTIELNFVAQSLGLVFTDLVKTPFLLNVRALNKDELFIDLDSGSSNYLYLMSSIIVTGDVSNLLDAKWKSVQAQKIKNNEEERKKKIGEYISDWEPNPELSDEDNTKSYQALIKEAEAKFQK